MIFAAVEALAESIALLRKAGVDEHDVRRHDDQHAVRRADLPKATRRLITKQQYQPPGFCCAVGLEDVLTARSPLAKA